MRRLIRFSLVSAMFVAGSVKAQDAGRAPAAADPRTAMRGVAQAEMKPLAWMIGEWEGPATFTVAQGRSMTVTQHEVITWGAFETAMFIHGWGTVPAGGAEQMVFESAGFLTYNAGPKEFLFVSTGGTGYASSDKATVAGTTLSWGFTSGGERTKYDITLTSDGKWKELGYASRDGGATWTQNFEMLLSRKK